MQKLFNKVLLPVEFSAPSNISIDWAIDIAKQYNCSVGPMNSEKFIFGKISMVMINDTARINAHTDFF